MVWHIFKKDFKLLWSFILLAALLHWINALVYYQRGLFSNDVTLEMLSEYLPELALFASMFLIAAIVHLDAIPGVRQDWLIRPVPRGALLLEKFLFVLVAVEGPVFVANLAEGLADGFSLAVLALPRSRIRHRCSVLPGAAHLRLCLRHRKHDPGIHFGLRMHLHHRGLSDA